MATTRRCAGWTSPFAAARSSGCSGPNGAGKTTTVEILEGYRSRSQGEVSVLGHDPAQRSIELRRQIGIVLQAGGIYSHITPARGAEALGELLPASARLSRR